MAPWWIAVVPGGLDAVVSRPPLGSGEMPAVGLTPPAQVELPEGRFHDGAVAKALPHLELASNVSESAHAADSRRAQGLPYYLLTNKQAEYLAYEYTVTYTAGENCAGNTLAVAFNDNEVVRSSQCFYKCTASPSDPVDPICTYIASLAANKRELILTSGSNAVCATGGLAELQRLCSLVDECAGITHAKNSGDTQGGNNFAIGYLNGPACTTGSQNSGFGQTNDYYRKDVAATPSCPLGVAVEVEYANAPTYACLEGLYERTASSCPPAETGVDAACTQYDQIGSSTCKSRISWDAGGCGWVYAEWTADAVVTPPSDTPCVDNVNAANAALHQTGANIDFDPAVCTSGQTVGYCNNVMFSMMCAATCSQADCHVDNEAAAGQYIVMLGLAGTGCAGLSSRCGSDIVAAAMCPVTCAARRLSAVTAPAGVPARFRAALRKLTPASASPRALQAGTYTDRYYSWNPTPNAVMGDTSTNAACGAGAGVSAAVRADLDRPGGLWDRSLYAGAVATMTGDLTCPADVKYTHLSERYCQHRNIPAAASANQQIVDNQCVTKCGSRVMTRQNIDGTFDWCGGNLLTHASDVDALCLSREQCEELCSSIEECHSIDMHRIYPRCYLNTQACASDFATGYRYDKIYDTLVKRLVDAVDTLTSAVPLTVADAELVQNPDDVPADDPMKDAANNAVTQWTTPLERYSEDNFRDTYMTYTGQECAAATGSTRHDAKTRAWCERECSDTGCWGFDYAVGACEATHSGVVPTDAAQCRAELGSCLLYTAAEAAPCISADGSPTLTLVADDWSGTVGAVGAYSTTAYESFLVADAAGTVAGATGVLGNNPRSIAAWVQTTLETDYTIMSTGTGTTSNQAFSLKSVGSTGKYFGVSVADEADSNDCMPGDDAEAFASIRINDGMWHHVAATYDGTNTRLYVDGHLVDSTCDLTAPRGAYATSGTAVTIGGGGFAGNIHSATVKDDGAWTQTEVLALVNAAETSYNFMTRHRFALRVPEAKCVITVANPTDGAYAGAYTRSTEDVYLSADNSMRVKYLEATAAPYLTCNGWHVQSNSVQQTQTLLYCEESAARAAALVVYLGLESVAIPGGRVADVCTWAQEGGLCTDGTHGAIVTGLCSLECVALQQFTSGGLDEEYQTFDGTYESNAASNCLNAADDHKAAHALRQLRVTPASAEATACADLTAEMCTTHQYFEVVAALCRLACAGVTAPVAPTTAPTDEADPEGASTRRLREVTWYEATTPDASWEFVYRSYLPECTAAVDPLAGAVFTAWDTSPAKPLTEAGQTWGHWRYPLETDVTSATVCRGAPVCAAVTTCVLNSARFRDELTLFRRPAGDTETTYDDQWFITALDQPLREAIVGDAVFPQKVIVSAERTEAMLTPSTLSTLGEFERNVVPATGTTGGTRVKLVSLGTDVEKVVVSMVDPLASTSGGDSQVLQELGRSFGTAPNGFFTNWMTDVIRVERFGADSSRIIDGLFEFEVYAPGAESLTFFAKLHDSETLVQITDAAVFGTAGSVTPKNGEPGWFVVSVYKTAADFVGAQDFAECSNSNGVGKDATVYCDPSTAKSMCTEQVGAAPVCRCRAENGFGDNDPANPGRDCRVVPYLYSREDKDFYFRLTHTDRLDYGLKLHEIRMYATYDAATGQCSDLVSMSGAQGFAARFERTTGTPAYIAGFYDPAVQTSNVPVAQVRAHYPSSTAGDFDGSKLFDEQTATTFAADQYFWSACLNCNPEVVDTTHMGAAYIEWYVNGDAAVECVQVSQVMAGDATDQPTGWVLERGPLYGTGCGFQVEGDALTLGGRSLCPMTKSWTVEKDDTGVATIPTTCGVSGSLLFGELLSVPMGADSTLAASLNFGSYAPRKMGSTTEDVQVPDVCACQQLCVDHIGDGCRAYKYYYPIGGTGGANAIFGHCYLLKSPYSDSSGTWVPDITTAASTGTAAGDWPDWTSGTPGLRLLGVNVSESQAAVQPIPAGTFSVTVRGVGLPASASAEADRSKRQRIKILPAGTDCRSAMPKEVSGLGCSQTNRRVQTGRGVREETVYTICSPKPQATSAEHATFAGIKIAAGSGAQTYEVCYCEGIACNDPKRWIRAPGVLSVARAAVTWQAFPATATGYATTAITSTPRMTTTGELRLRISRDAFGSFSNVADWAIKIVKSVYDCATTSHDSSKFDCDSGHLPTGECGMRDGDNTFVSVADGAGDAVHFDVMFTVESGDVGDYAVCFKESAMGTFAAIRSGDSTNAMFLTVTPFEGDLTGSRGVYGGQRFTALAGFRSPVNVSGNSLITPSTARVAVHSGTGCGANATFRFSPGSAVADTTAPVLQVLSSFPPTQYQGMDHYWEDPAQHMLNRNGPSNTVMLVFNEVVQAGTAILKVINRADVDTRDAEQTDHSLDPRGATLATHGTVDFQGRRVFLRWTTSFATVATGASTFYLGSGTEPSWRDTVFTDVAGNALSFNTKGTFEFEVVEAAQDRLKPTLLGVGSLLTATHASGIEVILSEAVVAGSGEKRIVVVDCGNDGVCHNSDDGPTSSFSSLSTAALEVPTQCGAAPGVAGRFCGSVVVSAADPAGAHPGPHTGNTAFLDPGRRYRVQVPADALVDATGNGNFAGEVDYHYGVFCAENTASAVALKKRAAATAWVSHVRIANGRSDGTSGFAGADADWHIRDIKLMACNFEIQDVVVESAHCADATGAIVSCQMGAATLVHATETDDSTEPLESNFNNRAQDTVIILRLNRPAPLTSVVFREADTKSVSHVLVSAKYMTGNWTENEEVDLADGATFVLSQAMSGGGGTEVTHATFQLAGSASHDLSSTPEAVFAVDSTNSSAGGHVFQIDLPSDIVTAGRDTEGGWQAANGHKYTVCYCDPQDDSTLEVLGNSENTYSFAGGYRQSNVLNYMEAKPATVRDLTGTVTQFFARMMPVWVPHNCKDKCSKGCAEANCFCDGYETGNDVDDAYALCLSPALCRQACDDHSMLNPSWSGNNSALAPTAQCVAGGTTGEQANCGRALQYAKCAGIEIHPASNKCFLIRETEEDCNDAKEAETVSHIKIAAAAVPTGFSISDVVIKSCDTHLADLSLSQFKFLADGVTETDATYDNGGSHEPIVGSAQGALLFDGALSDQTAATVTVSNTFEATSSVYLVIALATPARVTDVWVGQAGLVRMAVSGSTDGVTFSDEVQFRVTSYAAGVFELYNQVKWHAARKPITQNPAWQTFTQRRGRACTEMADFGITAGTLTVTDRARIMVDYIFEVDRDLSIEVTNYNGKSLTYDASGLSRDRITVVDCKGQCGISEPTSYVQVNSMATTIAEWNGLYPTNFFVDPAHVDAQNAAAAQPQVATVDASVWSETAGKYCPQSNIDLAAQSLNLNGVDQSLDLHQCYGKCGENGPCVGDNCFCDGFFSGFDGPGSNALCLDETMCKYFCDRLDDCKSIDMHNTLPRCFLNTASCEADVTTLVADASYKWLLPAADPQVIQPQPAGGNNIGCAEAYTASRTQYIKISNIGNVADWSVHEIVVKECHDVVSAQVMSVSSGAAQMASAVDGATATAWSAGQATGADGAAFVVLRLAVPARVTEVSIRQGTAAQALGSVLIQGSMDGTTYGAGKTVTLSTVAADQPSVVAWSATSLASGVAVQDLGFSYDSILRYRDIKFTSGGTFKLCFCDSESVASRVCQSTADYAVEVGAIHVSGVSCLLTALKFQRFTCCTQYYGQNLRCYRYLRSCPAVPPPMIADDLTVGTTAAALPVPRAYQTWCLYGPEEITQNEPNCQLVAGFQGAVP